MRGTLSPRLRTVIFITSADVGAIRRVRYRQAGRPVRGRTHVSTVPRDKGRADARLPVPGRCCGGRLHETERRRCLVTVADEYRAGGVLGHIRADRAEE